MAHLVRHRTRSGEVVSEEVADLDAAVALVERLRNEQEADEVRVFAEVPLRFETYVRVSVAADAQVDAEPTAPEVEAPVASADPEVTAEPVPPPPGVLAPVRVEAPSADGEELVDAGPVEGRRGLFHR
jgi:hypothetical protein